MDNIFDQFDEQEETQANMFDQFDEPATPEPAADPTPTDTFFSNLARFGGNLWNDTKDVATGMVAPILNPDLATKAMSDLMYDENGEFSSEGWKRAGSAIVDRAEEIITDPAGSLYDRPVSTLMDVATVAMPTRAAGALIRPVNNAAGEVLSKTATVLDNFDPLNAATTGAAALQSRVGAQERMEEILKPSLSETDIRMQPKHRERVIQGALNRGIMPTDEGMGKLYSQIRVAARQADEIIEQSDATVSVAELSAAIREQARRVPDSDKNAIQARKAIESEADNLEARYEGRDVIGAVELRELRRSADDVIAQNRLYLNGEPVRVQADKVYANTIRGVLGEKVAGLKPHNAEMSELYDIADLYIKPTQRLRNNNRIGLGQQIAYGNAGASVGGGSLLGYAAGLDPVLGGAIGLGFTGLASRANNPLVKMARAQRAHDVANNGLLFRDAGRYRPYSDMRYGSLLINDLMEQSEEERD